MPLRSIPPRTACKRNNEKEKNRILGADPVRFRTRRAEGLDIGGGGIGSIEGNGPSGDQDVWKPSIQQTPSRKPSKSFISEPPENPRRPEIEKFEDKKQYQVIVDFPHHQENEIKVGLKDDILIIESTKTDLNYHEEILLSKNVLPEDYEQSFNNGILAITFKKKQLKRTSKK